ncbi:MAG: serine hydrolase [Thalassobaculaceae bacterium]|nr:serine hydrolase [Thalassobaculaceae bacterium]
MILRILCCALAHGAVLVFPASAGAEGRRTDEAPGRAVSATRLDGSAVHKLGWHPDRLDEVLAYATGLSTDTLLVETGGRTVAILGDPTVRYTVHSIRKALLSTVVGQHVGDGERQIALGATLADLDIDDSPVPLTPLQRTATVEDLLRSRSGINHAAAAEAGLTSEKNRMLGTEENLPGSKWAYNNWDYNALTTIFEQRTGLTIAEAFATGIAGPLELKDFQPGDVSYDSEPALSQHPAAAFHMSGRDLARIGRLYLDGGKVGGTRVLDASWIDRIDSMRSETGLGGLRAGHSLLWWLPGPETGFPDGTYMAWGLGNQALFVIPAWDTVIVHQSDMTEFLKRFLTALSEGGEAEAVLEDLVVGCLRRRSRDDPFCVEDRFIGRREFDGLVERLVVARR